MVSVYPCYHQKKEKRKATLTLQDSFGGGGGSHSLSYHQIEHQRTSRMISQQYTPNNYTMGTTRDITRIPPGYHPDTTLIPKPKRYQDGIRQQFLGGYHPDTIFFGIRVEFFNGYHPDTILIPFQRKQYFTSSLF